MALTVGINAASTASFTAGRAASFTLAPLDNLNSNFALPSRKFDSNSDMPSVVADSALPNSIPEIGIIFCALDSI